MELTIFATPRGLSGRQEPQRKADFSIPDKTQKTLSEIIGGAGKGVIGSNIYWLCCRAAPDNSNNLDDDKDVVTGVFRGKNIGATEEASHTGLTPSQVKQLGSWR